jgi:membrane protease YdiL (CAAX protease family)
MNQPHSQKIDRKGMAVFLALSFGLAWPIITLGDFLWDSATAAYAIHGTAMLAPGLACLVVQRWVTKSGFRGIGLQRVSWRAYVVVILGCFLLWGIPRLIDLSLAGHLRAFSTKRLLFTMVYFFTGLIPAFGEELGWRGYLLPSLLPIGRRKALLLHGAIWGAWHWPILFASLLRGDIDAVQCIMGMILMLPASAALGLVVGWLWLRFGSVLLVTVWHFSWDYSRDFLNVWFEPGHYAGLLSMIPYVVVCGCALLVLFSRSFPYSSPRSVSSSSSRPR